MNSDCDFKKFFKLNENYELDFINSIVHDDKTIIKDFAIFENNILISYKNILELRVFNKILITKKWQLQQLGKLTP